MLASAFSVLLLGGAQMVPNDLAKGALWASAAWCLFQILMIQLYSSNEGKSSVFSLFRQNSGCRRLEFEVDIETGSSYCVKTGMDFTDTIEIALRAIAEAEPTYRFQKGKLPCVEIEIKQGADHLTFGDVTKVGINTFRVFEDKAPFAGGGFVLGHFESAYSLLSYKISVLHINPAAQKASFLISMTVADQGSIRPPQATK